MTLALSAWGGQNLQGLGESLGRPSSVYVVVADSVAFLSTRLSLSGIVSALTTTTVGRLAALGRIFLRAGAGTEIPIAMTGERSEALDG